SSRRSMILVHRDELIRQAQEKLAIIAPSIDVGIVKAERNEVDKQVLIASVQTVSRLSRLKQLPDDIDIIVIDEAHHAVAETYRRVLDYLEPRLTLGFTAAADRGDEQGLSDCFDEIVYEKSLLEMITKGSLADTKAKKIRLKADYGKLPTRHGDFIDSEVEKL